MTRKGNNIITQKLVPNFIEILTYLKTGPINKVMDDICMKYRLEIVQDF